MKSYTIKTIILGLALAVLSFSEPLKTFANGQFEKCVYMISSNCKPTSNPIGF